MFRNNFFSEFFSLFFLIFIHFYFSYFFFLQIYIDIYGYFIFFSLISYSYRFFIPSRKNLIHYPTSHSLHSPIPQCVELLPIYYIFVRINPPQLSHLHSKPIHSTIPHIWPNFREFRSIKLMGDTFKGKTHKILVHYTNNAVMHC